MKKRNERGERENADLELQTRVLIEDMRHKVTTVAEGHGILVTRLEKLEGDLKIVKANLADIQQKFGTFRNIVFDINQQLINHEGRIAGLENKI
jgi:hypothetical protein